MKLVKALLGLLLALCFVMPLSAQKKSLRFHGKPDYYLECQSEAIFKVVDEGLDAFPPVVGAPLERRLALYNLDGLLHDTRNDNTEAFRGFVTSRVSKLLADLEKPLKRGLRIYKIYNEAFVVRTKSATIAFDFSRCRCRGHKDPIVPTELAEKIVAKCDALFLTHNHSDHVDRHIVDLFVKAGKPVVAAPSILADKVGVTHRRNEDGIDKFELKLKSGKVLQVSVVAAIHGKVMNNVYVVTTPDKYTVCHTGDMSGKGNFKWIPTIKDEVAKIDALLVNCWTGSIAKVIPGFDPRYVITGHENEMGHTIDHREAYWLSFTKLANVDYKYVVMAWGEWFSIK